MKQHRITKGHPLLDADGRLIEAGYATEPLLTYRRSDIRAGRLRIKEWDYYLINTADFAVALTIADNSYMGLTSISLMDFKTAWFHNNSPMTLLPMGKTALPSSSEEGSVCSRSGKNGSYRVEFEHHGSYRLLRFDMENFCGGVPIHGQIRLENVPTQSMVIATPFTESPTAFYYNQKINCLPASGEVRFGDRLLSFREGEAFGVLDWGRGVWPYKNIWYWGSASGLVDGVPFGWNIGYGFGDTSAASENMLFWNHQAHKLGRVEFHIPQKADLQKDSPTSIGAEDFLRPWTITSDDGRFEMEFHPILDRNSCTDVKLICSIQHQVFGRFNGKAVLDNGRVIEVKDFIGFAEKVFNKW